MIEPSRPERPDPARPFPRAVVSVEATRVLESERGRAERLSDLFAWCGGGELTPNQVHAFLRPDGAKERPRAAGLLLRTREGHHYLVTASHVLSDRGDAAAAPPFLSDTGNSPAEFGSPGHDEAAGPQIHRTELIFSDGVLPQPCRSGWFPAASFPHLDLAVVRMDDGSSELPTDLEGAGFSFVDADQVGDEPTSEGAIIDVIGPEAAPPGKGVANVQARVLGLNKGLSFFWTDLTSPEELCAAPVVERDRIIGFLSPQVGSTGPESRLLPSPCAAVVKAAFLKRLLAEHEGV